MSLGAIQSAGDVELSLDQRRILLACITAAKEGGKVISITGAAGVGKSVVFRELKRAVKCVTVAFTGIAALNVGAQTIHGFFSLPIGPLHKGKVSAARAWNAEIIRRCDCIVVDEISMCRADLVDGMDWCLQKTMNNRAPFGGKTMIFFGDPFQLEPVVSGAEEKAFIEAKYKSPYWFDALVFQEEAQAVVDFGEGPYGFAEGLNK